MLGCACTCIVYNKSCCISKTQNPNPACEERIVKGLRAIKVGSKIFATPQHLFLCRPRRQDGDDDYIYDDEFDLGLCDNEKVQELGKLTPKCITGKS